MGMGMGDDIRAVAIALTKRSGVGARRSALGIKARPPGLQAPGSRLRVLEPGAWILAPEPNQRE